jgi:hypothetical protein
MRGEGNDDACRGSGRDHEERRRRLDKEAVIAALQARVKAMRAGRDA